MKSIGKDSIADSGNPVPLQTLSWVALRTDDNVNGTTARTSLHNLVDEGSGALLSLGVPLFNATSKLLLDLQRGQRNQRHENITTQLLRIQE